MNFDLVVEEEGKQQLLSSNRQFNMKWLTKNNNASNPGR